MPTQKQLHFAARVRAFTLEGNSLGQLADGTVVPVVQVHATPEQVAALPAEHQELLKKEVERRVAAATERWEELGRMTPAQVKRARQNAGRALARNRRQFEAGAALAAEMAERAAAEQQAAAEQRAATPGRRTIVLTIPARRGAPERSL